MAAPDTTRSAVGLRWVNIYALNANGSPAGTGTTVYEGLQLEGAKQLTLTPPEPRQIVYTGDDTVLGTDILPPDSAMGGELAAGKSSDEIDALLTGNASFSIGDGEGKGQLIATDNQGFEPQVALLAYRQGIGNKKGSASFGQRLWEAYIVPKAWVLPRISGFSDAPGEEGYVIRPQVVNKHLWETPFGASEAALTGQAVRVVTEYEPHLVAFLGNNVGPTFLFHTSRLAQSTSKISVWVDGVLQTAGLVTKALTGVVFTTAPTTSKRIAVFYEKAA